MNFCPFCGAQIQVDGSKFCHECGKSLQSDVPPERNTGVESSRPEPEPQESDILQALTPKTYDLGVNLEKMVADIHRSMGYSVETRRRIHGKSGAISEIDVVATRGKLTRAIECKNYDTSRTIGSSLLRVFADKLRDAEIYEGLFVTNSDFSSEAAQIADYRGIDYWNGQELYQRYYSHLLGRAPALRRELVLPLRQSFSEASTLRLRNNVVVNLFDRILFYHPYYVISYRLRTVRSDPKGKHHKALDEGTYIVDALDGHIVNAEKGLLSVVSGLFKSSEEHLASKIDGLVAYDLLNIEPVMEAIAEGLDYKVRASDPNVALGDAVRIVKFYVIEKNTEEVSYEVMVRGEAETRSMKIVPKMNEITVRRQKTVYVPIWELDYEAGR